MGDFLIYVIIIVLVVLKILFWTFYFYARAQRNRAANAPHRILVVDTGRTIISGRRRGRNTDRMIIVQNEHLPAQDPAYSPDIHSNVVMPPSYDDVVSGANQPTNQECKPPAYDQVIQGQTTYSVYPSSGNQTSGTPSSTTPGQFH